MGPFRLSSFFDLSARVGTLFGIPIRLHITIVIFLIPALQGGRLGFWHGLEYALGVVLSILIHELGHALTAKRYRLTGLSITLHGFGGFAMSSGKRTPRQSLVISLAGPAATFALGFLLLLVGTLGMSSAQDGEAAYQFFLVHFLGKLNVFLGFLNLIPCLPWDGGNALQAILAHRMSEFKAMRLAAHVGLALSAILLIAALFGGMGFFWLFAIVGLLTCYTTLANSGGIRFGEAFANRKHRKEMERVRQREAAKVEEFVGQVKDRERERAEKERLRKLFEASGLTDDE